MSSKSLKMPQTFPDAVDTCGTGGDGLDTINISTGAAFVAAAAGAKIAKHGNRAVSSRSGSADVLSALGVRIDLSPAQAADCLELCGISFLFAPSFHPAMKHAAPVRKELGVRTVFNILGPLCNPAGARRAVIGVFSESLCRKMVEAARELGFERMMAVHGSPGMDEISISGPTRVCELKHGSIREYTLSPSEFDLPVAELSEIKGGGPDENAKALRGVLDGSIKGPKRDVTLLNAAAALMVAGKADSWRKAFALASSAIDSGAAASKLAELRKTSESFALCATP
jgi:anthranilate phosphoribosyltransferase